MFPWGSPIYPFKIIDGFSLTKTQPFWGTLMAIYILYIYIYYTYIYYIHIYIYIYIYIHIYIYTHTYIYTYTYTHIYISYSHDIPIISWCYSYYEPIFSCLWYFPWIFHISMSMISWYYVYDTIWLFNIVMERSTIFNRLTIYKWAIFHGYVTNYQRVVIL